MPDRRTNPRRYFSMPLQQECTLLNGLSEVKSQIADISKEGLKALVNETTPLKNGDKLNIYINSTGHLSRAEVRWTKKIGNFNKTVLGLKLFSRLVCF